MIISPPKKKKNKYFLRFSLKYPTITVTSQIISDLFRGLVLRYMYMLIHEVDGAGR